MVQSTDRVPCHVVWCIAGFLFPAAIFTIGCIFERNSPPDANELAALSIHPDVLVRSLDALMLGHVLLGALAVYRWRRRMWVYLITVAQIATSLYWWFLGRMAVWGSWL